MAKEPVISLTFVKKYLKDNDTLYPITKEKLEYFSLHINQAYKEYGKHKNEVAGHKRIEDFAKEIIEIHNQKFSNLTLESKRSYHKQPQHIDKIIRDYLGSLVSKNDPNHVFTYVNPKDDARIDRLKEIINVYSRLIHASTMTELKKRLLERLINQMVSGVHLLSMNQFSDSMIIWRSLIESITYYKVIKQGDKKTTDLFMNRRDNTAKIIGLVPATKAELTSIATEIENRKMGKSASWWEKQRFSWAKKVMSKGDPSVKTLMECVNLAKFYPHYQVASLFTHEYLLGSDDFKVIDFLDYLIHLYWRALEEIKDEIKKEFVFKQEDLTVLKKHEETIRNLLKTSREAFSQFAALIGD